MKNLIIAFSIAALITALGTFGFAHGMGDGYGFGGGMMGPGYGYGGGMMGHGYGYGYGGGMMGPGYGYGRGYNHMYDNNNGMYNRDGSMDVDSLQQELGLNDRQVEKVIKINSEYRSKFYDNRFNGEKLDSLRLEYTKKIYSILTQSQRNRLQEYDNYNR